MNGKNIVEKELRPVNGFLVLIIVISGLILSTALFINSLLMIINDQTPMSVGLMFAS